jgi:biotin synthase
MNYILPKIKRNGFNSEEISIQIKSLIDKLGKDLELKKEEYLYILDNISNNDTEYLFNKAYEAKLPYYQNRVYLRGLVELSNHCKMGCKYCGINYKVKTIARYRLLKDEIIECCDTGYTLGYRTFVLQSGEDSFYTDEYLEDVLKTLKSKYTDIRITLSLGERSYESYKKLYDAGADRYLLRHETASKRLYEHIHASFMSFENRRECLNNLKEIGYQVGAGFMVGSPTQNNKDLVEDLLYLKELNPHMVGIGPYLCHSDTELKGNLSGTLTETLIMVALVRLMLPKALLPATTALGTLDKLGRENALKVGANVMMPNISPTESRELYEIYQDKICTGDTSIVCRGCIETRIKAFGHSIDLSVGDFIDIERNEKND